jgi:hypothetical protein
MVNRADREAEFDKIREEVEAEIQRDIEQGDTLHIELEELASLEAEVGLDEMDLDEAAIDTVAADTTDDNLDADDDGIEADLDVDDGIDDNEIISDLPQEDTQSYGTGLQGAPSDRAGRWTRYSRTQQFNEASPVLTGGDVDANYEQANAVGDESVGGTVATPDQDIVDEIGAAVGLEMNDRAFLRTNEVLEQRDDQRWELDPMSSEDYGDRRD